jgi:hypothetical protein
VFVDLFFELFVNFSRLRVAQSSLLLVPAQGGVHIGNLRTHFLKSNLHFLLKDSGEKTKLA